MRKLYFTLTISILVKTNIFSQTAPILFSLPTTKFCSGQIFPISFTNDPSLDGHTFQVQLSNSSGSFASDVSILGSGTSTPISCTMISAITYNESSYKIQIVDITSIINFSAGSNIIIINDLGSHLFINTDSLLNSSANTTVCNGSTLKLFPLLVYFDDYAISYQWRNSLNPNPSTVISNQNKISVSELGNYSYSVSKPGCTGGTSYPISISFSSTINSFLTFPGNIHCNGVSVPLTPSYVSQTSTYEWKKDNVIIPNAINRQYNATTTGNYSVKITDKSCQISNNSTLSFGNNIPCQILAFSDTTEICNGSTSYLNAIAGKLEGNTLEWFRNGQSITSSNQFLRAIPVTTSGVYIIKLREGNCTAISNPVFLKTVTSFKPTFTISTETTICASTTILTTNTEPGITKSYQWQRNGINLSGATSYFYYTGSTSEPFGGSYTLKVSQGNCIGISNPVNITVVGTNPTYKITASNKVCSTSQRLSILPTNSTDSFWQYEFQWFKDGIAIENAIANIYDVETSGLYKVRITKSNCVGF